MSMRRTLSKQDMLRFIRRRAETGITRSDIAKEMFISNDAVRDAIIHYGLKDEWVKAKRKHERKVALQAIEIRKVDGVSVDRIADMLGFDVSTIYKYLRRHDLIERFRAEKNSKNYAAMDGYKGTGKKRIPISWLYTQRSVFGLSYREIAEQYKCTPSRISWACKKYNIPKADKQTALANRSNVNDALEKAW